MHQPSRSRSRLRDRRLVVAVAVAVTGVAIVAGAWVVGRGAREPLVSFRQAVPADVESEAVAAVAAFNARFEARRSCIGGVEVVLVDAVAGGDARYVPEGPTIEIAIPTSPRRFQESLVHELAHHVEHTCPEFEPLRAQILTLTGEDVWTGQQRWADRPAEQWAEAVVAATLGERVRFGRTMPLDPGLVDAVVAWAAGD